LLLHPVYAILDGPVLASRGIAIEDAAEALLDGGIRLLQIRWKADWTRGVYDSAALVAKLCSKAGAMLVVNDRADIAALLRAGLHIGQDDLPPQAAREVIGPYAMLGLSTHNEAQFLRATDEPVDYIALGPVYRTASKLNPDPVVGVDELGRLRALTDTPVVAIGGITLDRAREVWAAGADSVAIVADLYPPGCTAADILRRAREWTTAANEHNRQR
jgi:thiamine-phosphate pyrophosphorylase